jgi:integrase
MSWLHGRTHWGYVPLRDGTRKRRSFGTGDAKIAREIEAMLRILRGRRDWQLLEAAAGSVTVGVVYDYWQKGEDGLSELRAIIADVDISGMIAGWRHWAERNASQKTVAKYERQIRVLVPEGKQFPRSRFSRKELSAQLSTLAGSGSTVRRYHAAWSSLGNYLVETETISFNPLRSVRAPRSNAPKELSLELPDVVRLIEAQRFPYNALAALREGAGVEISAALKTKRVDVNEADHTVHAHGSKNPWRDRIVLVDDWAWPYFMKAYKGKLPGSLLFEEITEERARAEHRRAVKALSLDARYTMHDARHSFAVRWMRDGANPQDIANNLGHKDATLVLRIYGKYRLTASDLRRARGNHAK